MNVKEHEMSSYYNIHFPWLSRDPWSYSDKFMASKQYSKISKITDLIIVTVMSMPLPTTIMAMFVNLTVHQMRPNYEDKN
jgi:hypothetical protein